MSKLTLKSLSAAVVGVASLVAASSVTAQAADQEKCYGVAKAGENGCASASGSHSCAGQSEVDYDGHEWKLVPAGTCEELGGSSEPFDGVNEGMAG